MNVIGTGIELRSVTDQMLPIASLPNRALTTLLAPIALDVILAGEIAARESGFEQHQASLEIAVASRQRHQQMDVFWHDDVRMKNKGVNALHTGDLLIENGCNCWIAQ